MSTPKKTASKKTVAKAAKPAKAAAKPSKATAKPAKAAVKPSKAVAKPTKAAAKPTKAAKVEKVVEQKKPVEKKPAVVEQPVAEKKPVAQKKPAKAAKKDSNDSEVAYENLDKQSAYDFSEMMKRRRRQEEEERQRSTGEIKLSRRPTSRTKGGDSMRFPEADLDEFRRRLIVLREEAQGKSASLKNNALEQSDERGSEDEDGSDAFMRLQSLSQVDSNNRVVQKIDEALRRISEGTYGICEVCGKLIRKPRLLNLPFVHTCMECQTAMEASRR